MKEFPGILISGQYFHRRSGGGITLSNLFDGWERNKIAAAAGSIIEPSFEICENYYQYGPAEFKLRFPFNLKHRSTNNTSGIISGETIVDILASQSQMKKSLMRQLYDKVLFSSGLIHYRSKFIISDNFLKWIKEQRP